jgi:hypothetical protein
VSTNGYCIVSHDDFDAFREWNIEIFLRYSNNEVFVLQALNKLGNVLLEILALSAGCADYGSFIVSNYKVHQ